MEQQDIGFQLVPAYYPVCSIFTQNTPTVYDIYTNYAVLLR